MRVFSISDLHLSINSNKPMDIFGPVWDNHFDLIKRDWKEKVAEDDIVLLCGDLSWAMKLDSAVEDIKLINELPGIKILLKGNHDYWWQSLNCVRKVLPPKFYCIQNDAIKIGDYIFCGSRGWVFPEGKYKTLDNEKIFNRELIRLELSLKQMQKLKNGNEKVIAMLHFPPLNNICENTAVTKMLEKYCVDFVVFGHIHKKSYLPTCFTKNNLTYFLTSCDIVENKLIEICEQTDQNFV